MTLEELKEKFDRSLTHQIAIADRAIAVADAIAAADSDSLPFRGLFYHLHVTQADTIILALGRLFDPPPRNYPTRSLLGFIKLLETQADTLSVFRRSELEEYVANHTADSASDPRCLSDPNLIRQFVASCRKQLDSISATPPDQVPGLLDRIRLRRDKQVAHNEDWQPTPEERASWEDARQLLAVAKEIAGAVGPALLGFEIRSQDGTYMPTRQSQMLGTQAERLIQVTVKALEGF